MEAVPSGTGVFYQAMPATGADGKKIMKLIPVQMVNGQFVPTRVSEPKAHRPPQKAATAIIASDFLHVAGNPAVGPSVAQPCSRKVTSHVTVLSNVGASGIGNPVTKHLPQPQTVNYFGQVPPSPAISMNYGELLQLTNQFQLTVKSPAFPRGQYLQIPPTAQVQSVPASQLPPALKKQIFTTQEARFTGPSPPTMLYLSPVTNVHQGVSQPEESMRRSVSLLSKEWSHGNQGALPACAKPYLKLIPKVSQRPNSPTRWVVEEVGDSAAVEPQLPASVSTSKTLPGLSERANSNKERGVVFKKAGSHWIDDNGGDGLNIPRGWRVAEENEAAELGIKCSPPSTTLETLQAVENVEKVSNQCKAGKVVLCQTSQSDSLQEEENPLVMFNGKVFFVAKRCSLAALKRKHPRQVDEVIDLCNNEAQDDWPGRAASGLTPPGSQVDEDTVIFVSYCPPKSQVCPASDLLPQMQMTRVRAEEGTCRTMSSGANSELSVAGRLESGAGDTMGLKTRNRTKSSVPRPGFMEVDAGPESPTPQRCSHSGNHKVVSTTNLPYTWTPPQAPKPCPVTDHQLRWIHGITADVQVCLQRTDAAAAGPPVQDHTEPLQGVRGRELHICHDPLSVQGGSVGAGQQDPAAPHAALPFARCSHQLFVVNTETPSNHKCHLCQTAPKKVPCDAEPAPPIGYMEPIDESFLSVYESGDPAARPHTQTCTVAGASTRRLGRTRKRTVCPCCSPSAVDPARKPVAQLQEHTFNTQQVSKRGSRTKTLTGEQPCRHNGSAGRSRQNCWAQEPPASGCPSTAPVDSDPVQRDVVNTGRRASWSSGEVLPAKAEPQQYHSQ